MPINPHIRTHIPDKWKNVPLGWAPKNPFAKFCSSCGGRLHGAAPCRPAQLRKLEKRRREDAEYALERDAVHDGYSSFCSRLMDGFAIATASRGDGFGDSDYA